MQKLFTEFEPKTAQQWKEQLVKDLKGIDFNTLISKTNEGIDLQPFYTSDNNAKQEPIFTHNDWAICERIIVDDEKNANQQALEALSNGVSGLEFVITKQTNFDVLLKGILLQHIYSYFHLPQSQVASLNAALKNIETGNNCFINTDVIAHLCETGNWHVSEQGDFSSIKNNTVLTVEGTLYQEAGANAVNELSFVMAHLNEYLNFYSENQSLKSLKHIHLSVSVGGDFFKEIAKLRALRQLVQFLQKQYDVNLPIHIHGQTTSINKNELDSYNNLLRSTTEAMSASIGGCNSVTVLPYDSSFNNPSSFSLRMARNQQLILKEESYLNKIADMSAGSYYIESLTQSLCDKAWEAFKQIEEEGGFIKNVTNNHIQSIIVRDATLLKQQFADGTLVLVGVNKYKNPNETSPPQKVVSSVSNEGRLIKPISKLVLQ